MKHSDSNVGFFASSHVCYDGRIYPWGVIRILDNGALERHRTHDGISVLSDGLAMWHPKLEKYGDNKFYAEINERGHKVIVRKRATGRKVTSICFRDFKSGDVNRYNVGESGFLHFWIDTGDSVANKISAESDRCTDQALQKAMGGKDPGYYDNSTFVLVDQKYSGQQLIMVGGMGERALAVYTVSGEKIPFKELTPLAFKKWGKKPPKVDTSTMGIMDDDPLELDDTW